MGKEINMNAGKVNINPNDLEDIVCEKCESQMFEPIFLFKKLIISKLKYLFYFVSFFDILYIENIKNQN